MRQRLENSREGQARARQRPENSREEQRRARGKGRRIAERSRGEREAKAGERPGGAGGRERGFLKLGLKAVCPVFLEKNLSALGISNKVCLVMKNFAFWATGPSCHLIEGFSELLKALYFSLLRRASSVFIHLKSAEAFGL